MYIKVWMHLLTPSEFLKKKLIENGFDENKITCIPTFTASKSEVGKPQVGTYGLYFGRVTEEKGVDTVVKAYEMMPNRHVKIMGDDTTDEAKRLKAYIKEKNIKNVEFLGFKAGEELEEIIKGARFTLIPSIWYDNLPNTALESFQYSKPLLRAISEATRTCFGWLLMVICLSLPMLGNCAKRLPCWTTMLW